MRLIANSVGLPSRDVISRLVASGQASSMPAADGPQALKLGNRHPPKQPHHIKLFPGRGRW